MILICRSCDPHRAALATHLRIKFCHNHYIEAASVLKHRDVSEVTKQRITDLLMQGYAPAAALEMYKYNLQLEHMDDYIFVSGDRAQCPDRGYVYRYAIKDNDSKFILK